MRTIRERGGRGNDERGKKKEKTESAPKQIKKTLKKKRSTKKNERSYRQRKTTTTTTLCGKMSATKAGKYVSFNIIIRIFFFFAVCVCVCSCVRVYVCVSVIEKNKRNAGLSARKHNAAFFYVAAECVTHSTHEGFFFLLETDLERLVYPSHE